jgi:hypothetical protein
VPTLVLLVYRCVYLWPSSTNRNTAEEGLSEMVSPRHEAQKKSANPLDEMMTSAQIARRKFKATLPRKIQNRRLSAMEALSEVFGLFDRLRGLVAERGLSADSVQAGLVYCLPESDPGVFAATIPLPEPSKIGAFCEKVMALDQPLFLGVFFRQEDSDTNNPAQKAVIFTAQFIAGPEAEGRLLAARKQQQIGSN